MLKKLLIVIVIISFTNCSKNEIPPNCLRQFQFAINRSLNNPDLNGIILRGSAEIQGGYKGIIVINTGSKKLAFDRICPENNCDEPLSFDGTFLICPCNGYKYSIELNGANIDQTVDNLCSAIEYRVFENGNSITITNF